MAVTNFPNGIKTDFITFTDTVWDDLRVPVLTTKLGGTKDPDLTKVFDNGSGSQGVFTYLFDKTTEEELYFAVQIPHGWKYETSLHPHVHWFPLANGSDGQKVSWGLEYIVGEINDVFSTTSIIYGDTPYNEPTSLVANTHYITEFPAISMTGVDSISVMLLCRIFRDAAGVGGTDDYDNDAALLEIDFHYESDRIGSDNEYS